MRLNFDNLISLTFKHESDHYHTVFHRACQMFTTEKGNTYVHNG